MYVTSHVFFKLEPLRVPPTHAPEAANQPPADTRPETSQNGHFHATESSFLVNSKNGKSLKGMQGFTQLG